MVLYFWAGFYTPNLLRQVPHKLRFWGCALLIALIFLIDGQLFSEGYRVRVLPTAFRQAAHLILLGLVTFIGCKGWANQPAQWVKKFWLLSYLAVIALLLVIGVIQYLFQPFSTDFLDVIGGIRLFFTSPMPYLVLFLLTRLVVNMDTR